MIKANLRRIVAWHPVLTDHQAYTYQELSRQAGIPVVVQVARLEDQTRRAQGWVDTRVTSIERQLIPKRGFFWQGLRRLIENRDQIHIFGSAFESPLMMLLLWIATRLCSDCYIISEPYSPVAFGYFDDRGAWRASIKARLRPYLYRAYVLALRGRLQGIFTISRLATHQYATAGMPGHRLYPFGYFVPTQIDRSSSPPISRHNMRLRLAFVGSLIAIKGLPTLIGAIRRAIDRGADLQADFYGPGDPQVFDFDDNRVRYAGRIPFGETQQRLLSYDLLVLPSNYDGWGVVVNEAICAGVPVLCSDHVGARVLIETFGAGQVFPCGDVVALSDMLVALARDASKLEALKSACPAAASAIQPSQAAAYIQQVLSTPQASRASIPSPWYGTPK